eukprot:12405287-Heterocapsa_arctica.AAC.1
MLRIVSRPKPSSEYARRGQNMHLLCVAEVRRSPQHEIIHIVRCPRSEYMAHYNCRKHHPLHWHTHNILTN